MITLTDEVYQHAERLAKLANRDVASVLADTLQIAISPVRRESLEIEPISDLTDEHVLDLTQLQMEPEQDAKLSQLLDKQQAGLLAAGEQGELTTLMQIYQEGLLRNANALSEAVKRGLIEPLSA